MADVGQVSGVATATTTGVSVAFGSGSLIFKATYLKISAGNAASSGGATSYVDVTQGASVVATTSMSYPLIPGENLIFDTGRKESYFSGFSAIQGSGTTACTLRYLAIAK